MLLSLPIVWRLSDGIFQCKKNAHKHAYLYLLSICASNIYISTLIGMLIYGPVRLMVSAADDWSWFVVRENKCSMADKSDCYPFSISTCISLKKGLLARVQLGCPPAHCRIAWTVCVCMHKYNALVRNTNFRPYQYLSHLPTNAIWSQMVRIVTILA